MLTSTMPIRLSQTATSGRLGGAQGRHPFAGAEPAHDLPRAASVAPPSPGALLRDGGEIDQLDRLWRQRTALCVEARTIPIEDDAACDVNFEARSKIDDQIEAMKPTASTVAALAMIGLHRDSDQADACHARPTGVLHSTVRILEHLRPHLTGLVAVHAADLLDADEETPVSEMAFLV